MCCPKDSAQWHCPHVLGFFTIFFYYIDKSLNIFNTPIFWGVNIILFINVGKFLKTVFLFLVFYETKIVEVYMRHFVESEALLLSRPT